MQGSVAAFLTYWLETVAIHRLRENTHTRYTACTRLYLIPGRKKLAKLTAKDVRTWLDQLRTRCQCCARSLDTTRNVRMGTPRPRRFEPLTADEARQLLAATHAHRPQALFELALHTGLRKGELLGLRWEDLDLAGGTASIRHTLQRTNSCGLIALPTKTQSSERRIALPTPCLRSLVRHRDQQRQERETTGAGWLDSGYVFTRPNGAPVEGATPTSV